MMRESEEPDARFVFVGFSRTNSQSIHLAASRRDKSEPVHENTFQPWNGQQFYYQLRRAGNRFKASYCGADNQWRLLAEVTNHMGTNYLVGLVVCPGMSDKTRATFGKVQWKPNSPAAGPKANRERGA
jgi:hypothetical protein